MKKSIALVAFLGSVLFSGVAFGQTTASSVKLNVNLYPMIAIQVGSGEGAKLVQSGDTTGEGALTPVASGQEVTLEYKTAEHYANGVSKDMPNHLTVFSTGAYKVSAKAQDLSDVVTASTISLLVTENGAASTAGVAKAISNNGVEIISGEAGKSKVYDVKYIGAGNNIYLKGIEGNAKTSKTTNVIYTVTVS